MFADVSGLGLICLALLSCTVTLGDGQAREESRVARAKRDANCADKYRIIEGHSACLPGRGVSVVSKADQKLIVDKHNEYRAQAQASNMMKLSWDEELAMIAQKRADSCHVSHEENDRRMIPGRFPSVGQNLAFNSHDWASTIDLFHSEVKDFAYGDINMDPGKVGHYTAVMWATTTLVGCGEAVCQGSKLQICNYGPGGNRRDLIHTPYKAGPPCQDCPQHCVDGKLCDCGRTCLNDGTLDLSTCQCTCPSGTTFYNQPTCSLDCSRAKDVDMMCPSSSECPVRGVWCPNKCHFCPSAGVNYTRNGSGKAVVVAGNSLLHGVLLLTLCLLPLLLQ